VVIEANNKIRGNRVLGSAVVFQRYNTKEGRENPTILGGEGAWNLNRQRPVRQK